MTSLPLHPAIVHLPLGLAFVIPAIAIALGWALWKRRVRPAAWIGIVALQAVLLGAGLVAMNTGEREEERVERIVPESALERHEAYATQFVWTAALTLVAAGLVLVFRQPRVAQALTIGTIVGTLAVAIAAVRVGRAGGQLVYVHNAAAAYTSAVGPTNTGDSRTLDRRSHGERDDDR